MRLEQSFEVPVPVARAWEVLLDVERIAPCMPGATLTGFDGETFTGVVKVKLGPISLAYRGNGRFVEKDEAGRRVALVASGQDSRGAGGAAARVTAVLHDARGGEATLVKVVTDLDIAGRAAQFGRGMINDVSGKLIKQFADCLAETIAQVPAPVASATAAGPDSAMPAAAAVPLVAPAAPVAGPPIDAAPPAAAPPLVSAPVVPPPVAPVAPPPVAAPTVPAPSPVQAAPPPPPAVETAPPPEPEYHPLALQEPETPVEPIPPTPPGPPPPPVTQQPASAYAYEPPPAPAVPPVEASAPPPPTPAAPQPRPAPKEAEPIDLLAITGAKGMLRRYAPIIAIVIVIIVVLIILAIVS
jgi:carbon monoxide dehydrogenase subunit G